MSRTRFRPTGHLRRTVVACGVLAVLGATFVPAARADAAPTPSVRLVGTVVTVPAGSTVLGPANGAARLTVDVALRPRDPAGLAAFAAAVSTPGDPRYHRYLAAGQFDSVFGPSPDTIAATRQWLTGAGLDVGATSADGLVVPVTGTTAQLEAAFAVPLVRTRLTSGRTVRLATVDPLVPASLAPQLTGVIGLGDQSTDTPQIVHHAREAPSPAASAVSPHGAVGPQACSAISSFPSGWTATQLAQTYGMSSLYADGRTGAGQTVGIFELEPFTPADIAAYQACYGTDVPVTTVPVDGGAGGGQAGEAALDIEVVAGLAPGSSIRVYSGPNDDGPGPLDTYRAMVDQDVAKVLSTSWGECEQAMDPAERSAESTLFSLAAAQGQSILAASGDTGSSDCWVPSAPDTQLAVDDPADQPDVTGVGGTSLTSVTAGAPTETVWGVPGSGGGGGGNSDVFAAPAYQQVASARSADTSYTCGTSHTQQCRGVPDVSASSDPAHGDIVYWAGSWWTVGGTSQASPLWAALVADTDQACADPAGLLGPALYGAGATSSFNDVTTGSNALFGGTLFTARPGYDLASGWGSPRALPLLALLSGAVTGCPTVTSLSTASGPAVGGTSVTITGTGFGSGTPVVDFGTTPAHVVASTPTSVTVTTPDVVYGGAVPVSVSATGRAAGTCIVAAACRFMFLSPTVTSVTAAKGPTSGGGRVTVVGTGFTEASTVTFGSTPATSVQVTSPTTLRAVVPRGPPGGGSVSVHVAVPALGTSPSDPGSAYDYALPGYLMAASDGGVFTYGAAGYHGSGAGQGLSGPVVGTAMAPGDTGYWMVTASGQVAAFGTAGWFGSPAGTALNHPVVGMAATPDGQGYWLVASDGGVFSYGDAAFHGSAGDIPLQRPVVGMATTPDGGGYWLVASDGGIFAYGDAAFHGSAGNEVLNRPVVGMAVDLTGGGLLAGGLRRRHLRLRRRRLPRLGREPGAQQAGGGHGRRPDRRRLLAGGLRRRHLRLRRRRILRIGRQPHTQRARGGHGRHLTGSVPPPGGAAAPSTLRRS